MKHPRIFLAIAFFVLTSLACQALTGIRSGNNAPDSENNGSQNGSQPTQASNDSGGDESENSIDTDFPMPDDSFNAMDTGDGSILFYTKLSAEEAMDFYREEFAARGYTEREILTVVSDGTFSMVFDGDPSGKAVVIQSVDLGDGSRTISIRLEAV